MSHLSRRMTHALRHDPLSYGLIPGLKGEVKVYELADALGVSVGTIYEIHDRDPKGRFVVEGADIRAAQGHSIDIDPVGAPSCAPLFLWHGTWASNIDDILAQGLLPMERTHVHLSGHREIARTRGNVVLRIPSAGVEGLVMAANGVWLTKRVPPNHIMWEY